MMLDQRQECQLHVYPVPRIDEEGYCYDGYVYDDPVHMCMEVLGVEDSVHRSQFLVFLILIRDLLHKIEILTNLDDSDDTSAIAKAWTDVDAVLGNDIVLAPVCHLLYLVELTHFGQPFGELPHPGRLTTKGRGLLKILRTLDLGETESST